MSAFYENHIRARKLARSPEHYAALVEVFCEIDRIAARLALSVVMDHGYAPPLAAVNRDYINARLQAAGVTPSRSMKWGEPIPITPAEYVDALGHHYYYWRAADSN